ncbi:TetR family transcriptional regulator [Bifidobacterium lemurum]|uniref:TetR family transcriptional regulator n=1 Tax=Bifidobacterium lemurum TaxID=1603886 RepID=A0A261FT75_9BIFI|nr:TetR/AcrR family transcriptional regulator C-terminal domain-containing protein [Bifidobacterium lemurum]OZG62175.1 TetR family transcriptional regulator [Bifidobacterium lemurum]QOL33552.1 TetR/AcrR family transcriptional regulator C-terminal domain-containing protein [Bifidobacterium lemurum]
MTVAKSETRDRRARRTRKAIDEAFLSLMRQKGFERITVGEVAERADINRATFYLHYVDKYDWMNAYVDGLFEELAEEMGRPDVPIDELQQSQTLERLFAHLDRHFDTYALLLSNGGGDLLQRRLKPMILTLMREMPATDQLQASPLETEFMAQLIASSAAGLIVWWVQNNRPISAHQVAGALMKVHRFVTTMKPDGDGDASIMEDEHVINR